MLAWPSAHDIVKMTPLFRQLAPQILYVLTSLNGLKQLHSTSLVKLDSRVTVQRVSSQARAADLHSTDLQAELRYQQEVAEERDAEIRRLQKVSKLALPSESVYLQDCTDAVFMPCPDCTQIMLYIIMPCIECITTCCLYLLLSCSVYKVSEDAVIMHARDNSLHA